MSLIFVLLLLWTSVLGNFIPDYYDDNDNNYMPDTGDAIPKIRKRNGASLPIDIPENDSFNPDNNNQMNTNSPFEGRQNDFKNKLEEFLLNTPSDVIMENGENKNKNRRKNISFGHHVDEPLHIDLDTKTEISNGNSNVIDEDCT